jgi:hypothetical protein
MDKPTLRLIKGGLVEKEQAEKRFVAATITDTRLMGATAMYIHWHLLSCPDADSLHQFFYFDDEEFGLETYRSVWGEGEDEVLVMEQALMGGLGGKKKDLTEKQARYLVCKYAAWNITHALPLPDGESEYAFILNDPPSLSESEKKSLNVKICTPLKSDYHVINYYLMRCFGRDEEGAGFLINEDSDSPGKSHGSALAWMPNKVAATFCRNTIEATDDLSYLCESLIETDKKYTIVVTRLRVLDLKIVDCRLISTMDISPAEAAMMLSRPEYVSVYEIIVDPEEFDEKSWDLSLSTMVTIHDNGKLFLSFNSNNNHVNKQVFRLSDDVFGLYYVSDFGQLILSASTLKNIQTMESKILKSPLGHILIPGSKFEFKEPVLYEFIQSDFDDFDEFVEYLNPEDEG